MKILALESSSPQRSVAVIDESPGAKWKVQSEVIETAARGANAIELIDAALRQAQVEREQIEIIAVGLGPGSYNGIRMAIAIAQGWQLAGEGRGIKLLGLSSAECVAAVASEAGIEGSVAVIIDAQRGEVYTAGYELASEDWREVKPLRLSSLEPLKECAARGRHLIGPEVTKWFPTGRVIFPRAATLGRLALGRRDFVLGEKLEPIYLREANFVKAPQPRIL